MANSCRWILAFPKRKVFLSALLTRIACFVVKKNHRLFNLPPVISLFFPCFKAIQQIMDTHSAVLGDRERQPLKDTSKHFVNNTPATQSFDQRLEQAKKQVFKKPESITSLRTNQSLNNNPNINGTPNTSKFDAFVSHLQKLSSGDGNPSVIGTSTPKKDGHIPYLTNPNSLNHLLNNKANSNGTEVVVVNANKNQIVLTKKMTGNELSKWQKTWKDILPKSFIYFDFKSMDQEKKQISYALKSLGASIESFFDENITIIISDRNFNKQSQYPNNDIFRHAIKKQMKVWSIEKVYRFLNHLNEPILPLEEYEKNYNQKNHISNNNNNNNNLSNLLMNERMFGPTDRDPTVKRNDFKYFTNYYLFIWDITQRTRPVAIREWKDKSYPKIHHTTNGKSLFIPESKSQSALSLLKRHQRRINCLNETFEFRQEVIESAYDIEFKNKNIRHPTFDERVAFKNNWEGISQVNEQLSKLCDNYLSLPESEREQFRSLFEKKNKNHHDDADLKRKASTLETTDKSSSINAIEAVDGLNKRQKVNPANENNQNNNNIDVDAEYDELNDLISDKSDIIDQMNTSFRRETLKNEHQQNLNKLNKIPPQLLRQDSLLNNNSQSGAADGKLREYGEITASGIQASGVNPSGNHSHGTAINNNGNGLGPSKSQVVNKTLAKESKRIVVLNPNLITKNITNKNKSKNGQLNVPDEIMNEIDQLPDDMSGKVSINEDELAALRSVEAAGNPFISEGYFNKNNISTKKDGKMNDTAKITETKNSLKVVPKEEEKSANNFHKLPTTTNTNAVTANNNDAKYGIFKDQKQERPKQELKPGYCENCRVKYSDFSEHIETDKHRDFAENDDNFKQIDELIKDIKSPTYNSKLEY